jgi:hypothetical protein
MLRLHAAKRRAAVVGKPSRSIPSGREQTSWVLPLPVQPPISTIGRCTSVGGLDRRLAQRFIAADDQG